MDENQLEYGIKNGKIDTVLVVFPDLQGRPVGKRITSDFYLRHVGKEGIEVCDYLLAVDVDMVPLPGFNFANWDEGYSDMLALPDLDAIYLIPWLEKTALVIADLYDKEGKPIEVSPRQMLKNQIKKAQEINLNIKAGTELEFYLFLEPNNQAREKGYKNLSPSSQTIQDYQIFETTKQEAIIRQIRNQMVEAGIPVEFSKGEAGRGQHEINVTYSDALTCADRHMIFKNGIKEIAALNSMSATFMAKFSEHQVGSSCHIHSSIWDLATDEALFASHSLKGDLSSLAKSYVAGLLASTKELSVMFAHYVNSYKRYVAGSWAPTAIAWGFDNRTTGFRIVGKANSMRVESRIPGADVNPYFALSSIIAGGLHGIKNKLDLEEPYTKNAYEAHDKPSLPTNLLDAIALFKNSDIARESFGPDVFAHLTNYFEQELQASLKAVTDWDLYRNFERI